MTDEPSNEEQRSQEQITQQEAASDPCAADPDGCKEAVGQLYAFLDGELTTESRASIRQHIDDCGHCFSAYEFHTELKMVISKKCQTALPEGLKDRVFDALRALDS